MIFSHGWILWNHGVFPAVSRKERVHPKWVQPGAHLGVLMASNEGKFGDADFIAAALEDMLRGTERGEILAHGTVLDPDFYRSLGAEAMRNEWEFNRFTGFTDDDDELPDFFYRQALPPTGKMARHHSTDVNALLRELEMKS